MEIVTAWGRGWLLPVSPPEVDGSLCRGRGRGPADLGNVIVLIPGTRSRWAGCRRVDPAAFPASAPHRDRHQNRDGADG